MFASPGPRAPAGLPEAADAGPLSLRELLGAWGQLPPPRAVHTILDHAGGSKCSGGSHSSPGQPWQTAGPEGQERGTETL